MKAPTEFVRIVNRKRYDVSTATLLASDAYWDGHNFERHGRNRFLYRTPRGAYFLVTLTQWQGERDTLQPLPLEDALVMYEHDLPEHAEEYADAFPGVTVEEA